ncbi:DoxX family protein [Cellulomonas sp. Marseille-Q8402]
MTTITTPRREAAVTSRTQDDVVTSVRARRVLAVLRLATGFIFLWAFLDKTFGLGYSTASEAAWINGGTPSQGFLTHAAIGPLADFFISIASPVSDVLFMLGMLGVGAAVMLGIGTRVAAGAGALIMAMMWLAEWPLQSGSSNPVIDYHVIYAIALVLFALTAAGDTWGLGRWWKSLPVVDKNRWLV